MGQEIWTTIVSEFSDLPDLGSITRVTVRLLLAAILGGILGYDRERRSKSAGVRTHMLVAVGSALFVVGPLQSGVPVADLSRVLQGIVQGIGFLGAGTIIVDQARQKAQGMTTAANIWATAGIGMLAGLGLEATAVLSALIVFIILAVIPYVIPAAHPLDPTEDDPEP